MSINNNMLKMNMAAPFQVSLIPDRKKQRSFLSHIVPTAILISAAFFFGSVLVVSSPKKPEFLSLGTSLNGAQNKWSNSSACQIQCRPDGVESLPKGIVSKMSNFDMQPLWGPRNERNSTTPMSLLAIAAGIKQKESVDKIVKKFPPSDFVVMLFHYDGIVDGWKDLEWSSRAIHISAMNQTKWWFAKRFLHPDIVYEYAYIFLWDEDLGVDNFHPKRYLTIIEEEGLEISQPGLDPETSDIHYPLTARDNSSRVHRRTYKKSAGKKCDEKSTKPPCTGFVEMMAPVFSKASWRCAWHMIQNDLVHAWGLDFQLGYCALGDRTKNIGIVDSEYVVHYGIPTLGGQTANKTATETQKLADEKQTVSSSELKVESSTNKPNIREEVKKRCYFELDIFENRWKEAAKDDKCWVDLFQQ